MNTNLLHNILNVLMLTVGLATLLGCTTTALGAIDCSGSWLGAQTGALLTSGFAFIKLAINVLRDGIGGLGKPQPPVSK